MSETSLAAYKSIDQIESETDKVIYCRQFDYARAVALTAFLRELEAEHGEEFRINIANPKLLCLMGDRLTEEQKNIKTFAIGLWARWSIGNVGYYLQMNENPFFDAYLTRHWRLSRTLERNEYASNKNGIFYANVRWDATMETIAQLVENIRTVMKATHERSPITYEKEIPVYNRKEKQTIYT